jgi:hypothetical protein
MSVKVRDNAMPAPLSDGLCSRLSAQPEGLLFRGVVSRMKIIGKSARFNAGSGDA